MIYWRRRLTRLELALYVGVIGIAIAAFVDRMLDTIELAERYAMELTLTQLSSAMNTRLALERISDRGGEPRGLLDREPFQATGMSVRNFHGELEGGAGSEVAAGTWAYDRRSRELLYVPQHRRQLRTDRLDGQLRFRWAEKPPGVALVPTHSYTWR